MQTHPFLSRGNRVSTNDSDLDIMVAHFRRLILAGETDRLRGAAEVLAMLQLGYFQEICLRLPALRAALATN